MTNANALNSSLPSSGQCCPRAITGCPVTHWIRGTEVLRGSSRSRRDAYGQHLVLFGSSDDCGGRPYDDLFYVFNVPETAEYTFDMCGSTGVDAYIKLWLDGTCCAGSNRP